MRTDYHIPNVPTLEVDQLWKQRDGFILADVRAPCEYQAGCIVGAKNLPLFSNAERSEIGTIYKHFGQSTALDKGYELLNESFSKLIHQFTSYKNSPILVYCARGGLRSKISVNLLISLGYNATQLIGGYKSYRNWCLKELNQIPQLKMVMLHGLAGSGKTFILENSENALNLEKLAAHSGSAFGAIGENPETQKQFEANLIERLDELDQNKFVYIEAESRKIGKLEIPKHLFTMMRQSTPVLIEAPLHIRVQRMLDRYVFQTEENQQELIESIRRIKNFFSKKDVIQLIEWVEQEHYDRFFEWLLVHHYDPKYKRSMNQYTFEHVFDGTHPAETAIALQNTFTDLL